MVVLEHDAVVRYSVSLASYDTELEEAERQKQRNRQKDWKWEKVGQLKWIHCDQPCAFVTTFVTTRVKSFDRPSYDLAKHYDSKQLDTVTSNHSLSHNYGSK